MPTLMCKDSIISQDGVDFVGYCFDQHLEEGGSASLVALRYILANTSLEVRSTATNRKPPSASSGQACRLHNVARRCRYGSSRSHIS